MNVWSAVRYLVAGIIVLSCLSLLVLALGFVQLIWSFRPHTRMASVSPSGTATVSMIENHKLVDTGVSIMLEQGGYRRELLYGEDCWPEFVHFAWSSDSKYVIVAWRDGLCSHSEQPRLKAWDVASNEEVPVDYRLRENIDQSIADRYFPNKSMKPNEALEWALAGGKPLPLGKL